MQVLMGVMEGSVEVAWPGGAYESVRSIAQRCLARPANERPSFARLVRALEAVEKHLSKPVTPTAGSGTGPAAAHHLPGSAGQSGGVAGGLGALGATAAAAAAVRASAGGSQASGSSNTLDLLWGPLGTGPRPTRHAAAAPAVTASAPTSAVRGAADGLSLWQPVAMPVSAVSKYSDTVLHTSDSTSLLIHRRGTGGPDPISASRSALAAAAAKAGPAPGSAPAGGFTSVATLAAAVEGSRSVGAAGTSGVEEGRGSTGRASAAADASRGEVAVEQNEARRPLKLREVASAGLLARCPGLSNSSNGVLAPGPIAEAVGAPQQQEIQSASGKGQLGHRRAGSASSGVGSPATGQTMGPGTWLAAPVGLLSPESSVPPQGVTFSSGTSSTLGGQEAHLWLYAKPSGDLASSTPTSWVTSSVALQGPGSGVLHSLLDAQSHASMADLECVSMGTSGGGAATAAAPSGSSGGSNLAAVVGAAASAEVARDQLPTTLRARLLLHHGGVQQPRGAAMRPMLQPLQESPVVSDADQAAAGGSGGGVNDFHAVLAERLARDAQAGMEAYGPGSTAAAGGNSMARERQSQPSHNEYGEGSQGRSPAMTKLAWFSASGNKEDQDRDAGLGEGS